MPWCRCWERTERITKRTVFAICLYLFHGSVCHVVVIENERMNEKRTFFFRCIRKYQMNDE